jgi:hypothetical protein
MRRFCFIRPSKGIMLSPSRWNRIKLFPMILWIKDTTNVKRKKLFYKVFDLHPKDPIVFVRMSQQFSHLWIHVIWLVREFAWPFLTSSTMWILQLYQLVFILNFFHIQNWVRMSLNDSRFWNSRISTLIWRRSCSHQVTILFGID